MATVYKLYEICKECGGTGKEIIAGKDEVTCKQCNGDKVKLTGYCSADTYDIPEIPS